MRPPLVGPRRDTFLRVRPRVRPRGYHPARPYLRGWNDRPTSARVTVSVCWLELW